MTEPLTTLLHDAADRVPAALHPAADLRRNARHHQRVRRGGAVASSVAAVLVVALIGSVVGGGDRRAAPPAETPPLSRASLLIPAEVPSVGLSRWASVDPGPGEVPLPAEFCQENSLASLGAESVWRQGLADPNGPSGGQNVARFRTAEEAAAAFDTLTSTFGDCRDFPPSEAPAPLSAFGGRIYTVSFDRSVGVVSYGIKDAAITMVWLALEWDPVMENEFWTTMGFALQRLAGTRAIARNAIPADFRFAEQRTHPAWQVPDALFRSTSLSAEWLSFPCITQLDQGGATPQATDALRTGAVQVAVGRTYSFRHLGIYPDAEAASKAAAELREPYGCRSTMDPTGITGWTIQPADEARDVTVFWASNDPNLPGTPARAAAILRLGNAVFLAVEGYDVEPGPDSQSVREVRQAVKDNIPLICEVADCP